MREIARRPVEWYADKVASREPFSMLLIGDGELLVASSPAAPRRCTTYQEMVTAGMVAEMRAALGCRDADVVFGTDEHLLDPHSYRGRDRASLLPGWLQFAPLFAANPHIAWHDGVVFDTAAREGGLAPLLRALHGRELVVVGNPALEAIPFLHPRGFVRVPRTDAYGAIGALEQGAAEAMAGLGSPCVVCCCGLAATPLVMRLRKDRPDGTYLDLGSTLDVFAGIGADRGWRAWLYARPAELAEVLRKNTEGVCGCGGAT